MMGLSMGLNRKAIRNTGFITIDLHYVVTWFSIDDKLGRGYKRIVDPIHPYGR